MPHVSSGDSRSPSLTALLSPGSHRPGCGTTKANGPSRSSSRAPSVRSRQPAGSSPSRRRSTRLKSRLENGVPDDQRSDKRLAPRRLEISVTPRNIATLRPISRRSSTCRRGRGRNPAIRSWDTGLAHRLRMSLHSCRAAASPLCPSALPVRTPTTIPSRNARSGTASRPSPSLHSPRTWFRIPYRSRRSRSPFTEIVTHM